MKTLTSTMLVILLASPTVCAGAERFRFELMDGTTIDGTMNELEQLTVKTAYGTLRIPIAKLVSFSPGLDSRPELAEKIDTFIRLLVSPDKADRQAAQEELIKIGPKARPLIERLAGNGDPDPEHKASVQAILAAYTAQAAKHPGEPVRVLREGTDEITTASFPVVGKIAESQLAITTDYGPLGVKLGDIWRAQEMKPRAAAARKDLIIVLDLLDGSRLRGKTEQKTLSLATAYGKLTLPLGHVGTVRFGDPGANARVLPYSGELLEGTLAPETVIDVTTTFGKVGIPLNKVARLSVIGTSAGLWNGLVAFWPGEGNAKDLLGRHDGKIGGRVAFAPGRFGKAFVFDGRSAHVAIPNLPGIRITGDQTIAMWIKPDRVGIRQNPLAKAYGGECTITLEPDGALYYHYGTSGRNKKPYGGYNAKTCMKAGQWTHIAVVRDLKAMKVTWYVNGVVASLTPARHRTAKASQAPLYLGRGYAGHFGGLIDEVALWKRALPAEDVAALYWNTPRPPEQAAAKNLALKAK